MTFPRITIVTPSYNQAQFIRETIESIINQGYPNLEYIIVDGGSTDGTLDIIREYEEYITWWVSEKDNGQSDALRKGFERATGEIMGWLNSDDVYFPHALFRVAEAYNQEPSASLYIGGVAVGAINDGPIRRVRMPPPRWTWWIKYGQFMVLQQGSFYNRKDYEVVGGIDPEIYIRMDGDIMYRLLQHNPKAMIINHPLGFFRWHGATKSSNSIDVYRREQDKWLGQIQLTSWRRVFMPNWFRLMRVVSGSWGNQVRMTMKFRRKRPSDIWSQARSMVFPTARH